MGTFKKRGKWWIGYSLGNGKYRREAVGPSHALAKEILAKRLTQVAERREFPARAANGRTFEAIADKFWDLHGRYLKSRSWRLMLNELGDSFGGKRLSEIRVADIQRHYNAILERASASTANRHLTLIRLIFNKAKAWGDFYGENPCDAVEKQREAAHRLRYLAPEEIKALLERAHPRLYPVLICALYTGMRRGEILGLRWENVNLDRGILYILKSKSGKPREIPLAGKLREVFLSLGPKLSGPIFDIPIIMLRRYFDRAMRDAGIAGFRFHDLRHTFASHYIMRTNDLPALQAILGHSTPLMTQRYAHLSRTHLAANMAVFEAAIPTASVSRAFEIAPILHHTVLPRSSELQIVHNN